MRKVMAATAFAAFAVLAGSAGAVTVQPLTFTVYFDNDYPVCCGVFQGSVLAASYATGEFAYGFAEFDLAGAQLATAPIRLSFAVGSVDNRNLSSGTIVVDAYSGNNSADRIDVRAPRIGSDEVTSLSFGTAVGTSTSVDITSFYNLAVLSNSPALGIRFRGTGPAFTSSIVTATESFTNVALSDFPVVAAVPEPGPAWLLLWGLLPLAIRDRRNARQRDASTL